jgi:hypothetical protein
VSGRIVAVHDDLVILDAGNGESIVVVTPNTRRVIVVGADAVVRMNDQPSTLATLRKGAAATVEYIPREGLSTGKAITAVQAPGAGSGTATAGAPSASAAAASAIPIGPGPAGTPARVGVGSNIIVTGGAITPLDDGRFVGPFAFGIAPVATDAIDGIISRVQGDVLFVRGNDGREFAVPADRATRFRGRSRNDRNDRNDRSARNDVDRSTFVPWTAVRLGFDEIDGVRTPTIQQIDPGPTNPLARTPTAGTPATPTAGNPTIPPPGADRVPIPGAATIPTPGVPPSLQAPGGLPQSFGGTISRISGDMLFMRTTAGQEFVIPTNSDTQFTINNQAARFQQFQPGMEIQVGQRSRGAGQTGMTISGSPGKGGSRSAPGGSSGTSAPGGSGRSAPGGSIR